MTLLSWGPGGPGGSRTGNPHPHVGVNATWPAASWTWVVLPRTRLVVVCSAPMDSTNTAFLSRPRSASRVDHALSPSRCQISRFSSPAGRGSPAAAQARGSLPALCSTCSCLAALELGDEPPAFSTNSAPLPPVSASVRTLVSPRPKDHGRDGWATVSCGEINSRIYRLCAPPYKDQPF